MTKKEIFINEIKEAINNGLTLSEDANIYFTAMAGGADSDKPEFTEKGAKILIFMQEHKESYGNMFKAADVATEMSVSSRTISGAARALVTNGYLEKLGQNPVIYSLTEKGVTAEVTVPAEEY